MSNPLPDLMHGISGAVRVTSGKTDRRRHAMFPAKCLATRISTSTASGRMSPGMDRSGAPAESQRTGHPIMTATGLGWRLGVGLGWMTHRGVTLPPTMAAGLLSVVVGDGCPVR